MAPVNHSIVRWLSTQHDVDAPQDLVQALRRELADAFDKNMRSTAKRWDALASECFGKPARLADSSLFPGPAAQAQLLG